MQGYVKGEILEWYSKHACSLVTTFVLFSPFLLIDLHKVFFILKAVEFFPWKNRKQSLFRWNAFGGVRVSSRWTWVCLPRQHTNDVTIPNRSFLICWAHFSWRTVKRQLQGRICKYWQSKSQKTSLDKELLVPDLLGSLSQHLQPPLPLPFPEDL